MSVTVVAGDLPPDLARALRGAGRIAVDTETSGLDWAEDRLHLCQLFTPATGAVLVRRVQGHPSQLATVLSDRSVVKVFHFAPFDLRFLESQWGARARSVACTKAASKLLAPQSPARAHSLDAVLARYLGVALTKGAVRTSDWGAPVLSDEQVAYAAADVAHLLDLYEVLVGHLTAAGLSGLYEQVCAYMAVDAHLATSGIPDPLIY